MVKDETGAGADWRSTDPINAMLYDALDRTLPGAPRVPSNLKAVQAEAAKLRGKLERAEQLLARLQTIPEHDPWGDGASLRVVWRNCDYLLLRARGLWYSTGRQANAPYRFTWAQLVDWLVAGDVRAVQELRADRWVSLSTVAPADHPDTPPEWCGQSRLHDPHVVQVGHPPMSRRCGGTIPQLCDDARTQPHEPHVWTSDQTSVYGARWLCYGAC